MILSPSILAADFTILGRQIELAERAGAQYLHIDVMDGVFVPSISFGMPLLASIRKASKAFYDVHLMIEDPMRYLEEFAECGADGITIHLEACDQMPDAAYTVEALTKIRKLGLKAGLTLKPATAVKRAEKYLPYLDMLLLMTVEPGFGGQKYIEKSTERIRLAKKMISDSGFPVLIEVDGGITLGNLDTVLNAGADVIVAGSAIFHGDIEENIKKFMTDRGDRQ